MKTTATPLRSLLLSLGALVAIAAVAWSVHARPQAAKHASGEQLASQTATTQAPAPVAAAQVFEPMPAPGPAVQTPGEAGLKAYVDPETGTLTSTPPRSATPLAAAEVVRPDHLPEIQLEDGSYMVRLDERFEESVVMTIDASGRKVMTCTQHPGAAHVHAVQPVDTREVK